MAMKETRVFNARILRFGGFLIALAMLISGCASYRPAPACYMPHLERAVSKTNGPIVASVAVLSRKEAEEKFGLALHKKNIQPVWLKLENTSTNQYYFLPAGLDPDYHSAGEVAYMHRKSLAGKRNRRVREVMIDNEISMDLPPNGSTEGFVYANYDPGYKHVPVDVIGEMAHYHLEFQAAIPGKRFDSQRTDWENLYPSGFEDLTLEEFRRAVEELPVHTTNKKGTGGGDPLNLVVVVPESDDAGLAFVRNGWDPTEVLSFGNALKLVGSFLFHSRWRTSPISGLYVFDRPQDAALQKARGTIHERNHLRLWLAPFTVEGRYVLAGQISRDIGLRFTFRAPGFVTHKIDPMTDEAREYLATTMLLSGSISQIAYVPGVGVHTEDDPGRNLTGDPWWTDGYRVVLFLSDEVVEPDEVHLLDWTESVIPPEERAVVE
jgi:hypothetical protein